jgi:hypothetical protein
MWRLAQQFLHIRAAIDPGPNAGLAMYFQYKINCLLQRHARQLLASGILNFFEIKNEQLTRMISDRV